MYLQRVIYSVLLIVCCFSCTNKVAVDLIVHHAKIYTANASFDTASAMAVQEGKIIAIGSNEEIIKNYASDNQINAEGKSIYPGFIDAHAHFIGYAFSLQHVNLTGTNSWQACIDKLTNYISTKKIKHGEWIEGEGWDQNDWDIKTFPTKALLDQYFPNNPIVLSRIDGHALIANQLAIDMAGIQLGQTIKGGSIEMAAGKFTGIFIDNAQDLITAKIPKPTKTQYATALMEAQKKCFATGLTNIQDCGLSKYSVDIIDSLQMQGLLKMKLSILLSDDSTNYANYLKKGPYKTDLMHVFGFKLYADGALGSRGACLINDYMDKPGWKGFTLKDRAYYEQVIEQIYQSKFQACTHAIGDSGNRMILQVYANVLKGKNDRRWRIEHAQIIDKNDFDYFGKYKIIPSVQPTHATSDMYWAEKRIGSEKLKTAYAYQQLLKQNDWIPLGTDFPVEDISPFKTFYAAVVREDAQGYPIGGFQMENALSRKETLWGMTFWAAKSSFEENEKGSLEKSKAADFIMIDTDLMNCAPADILKASVLMTFVNGQKVYDKTQEKM